ncbi:MAG: GMC family oxidoreductase [Bryobacteraceae bacterium]
MSKPSNRIGVIGLSNGSIPSAAPTVYDYVVIGSGAGGGTVASRLALAGHTVLVLEAGGDALAEKHCTTEGSRLPDDYNVPCFHAFSTENARMKWDFFVRHYGNLQQQQRDPKYYRELEGRTVDGVLYPRAGTLGGCTAHNALLTVYPHNDDWDNLARLTGDPSWSAANMRQYFERLENCNYRPIYRWLQKLFRVNPTRHGFSGWLSTQKALPLTALADRELIQSIKKSALSAFAEIGEPFKNLLWAAQSQFDPNDWRLARDNAVGLHLLPLATDRHSRVGTREFLIQTAKRHPDRLRIELDALAKRILLNDRKEAVAVEYLKGRKLYRAHSQPNTDAGDVRVVRASREVILCGGAFNSPQLLMLSGIGPEEELRNHKIPVLVPLPGVGRNLQDRYEVGVVSKMKHNWEILKGAEFAKGDPVYQQWLTRRRGIYTTNGGLLGITKKSSPERELPDLFMFALVGLFRGYFPGYSKLLLNNPNYLTWAILKAHTVNTAGRVTLRSSDARDVPDINFHYFEEGTDTARQDLESVVDGIQFVRKMTARLGHLIECEELPGPNVQSREELRQYIRDNAWGHHASCTCPIGDPSTGGVVNSDLEVHGVKRLRIVDASVFPRIPGFFIAAPIYMLAEKASDVISAAAERPATVPEQLAKTA